MLKTLDVLRIRCPVGFSGQIVALIHMKKSQIDTENDKYHKIFHIYQFLRTFCQIFDKLRGLENFKGSTRKKLVLL